MVQTVPASKVTLYDLEKKFQLQQIKASSFFEEWQQDLPSIIEVERRH